MVGRLTYHSVITFGFIDGLIDYIIFDFSSNSSWTNTDADFQNIQTTAHGDPADARHLLCHADKRRIPARQVRCQLFRLH